LHKRYIQNKLEYSLNKRWPYCKIKREFISSTTKRI